MDILKDFLMSLPLIGRVIAFLIGNIFWVWFLFIYPQANKNHDYGGKSTPPVEPKQIGAVIGDYVAGNKTVYESKKDEAITAQEKERLSPVFDIKLFYSPSIKYKLPLKKYVLMIQNLNQASASVYDFRVEFHFPNYIAEATGFPLVATGGDMTVGPINFYKEKTDGTLFQYEEQPLSSQLVKNFSLDTSRVKVNGKETNTNTVFFTCERWPEKAGFSGNIVIDLSKKLAFLKNPATLGKFEGVYFYKIKDKQFSEKINGVIPVSSETT